jgi:CubicO group peptidase (beta-lactamase class C family)
MRSLSSIHRVLCTLPLVGLAFSFACSDGDDTTDDTTLGANPVDGASVDGASVDMPASTTLSDGQKAELDDYIGAALGRYHVAGAAVAVVRGRDVLYQGTFGVRGVDDGLPVTPDTRFGIGSVAKSMTTLMMATLVDDGKVDWDTRATDVLPAFALSNPESTPQIRVRDLLNGTSGVPRFDTPFLVRDFSPTELVSLVQTIPTVAPPGQVFGYSNAMVSVGGYLGAVADGAAYDASALTAGYRRSIQQRVLSPIGMTRTTFDVDVAFADADLALPHAYDGVRDAIVQTPLEIERFLGSVLPAGGAWSSLRDMEAYASTQLSGIAPNGRRVVSSENLEQTHGENIANIPPDEWPTQDRRGAGYAMGWFTMPSYRGMRALSHDGNLMAYTAEVFLLPDDDLAVVVLCNSSQANDFYGAVEQFAVETTLALEHQGDALQLAHDQAFTGAVKGFAEQAVPVSREQALPLLGAYEHHARLEFTDQGFVLQTDFGPAPLAAFADSGFFIRTGGLTARLVAGFDSNVAPTELTLGLPGGDGLSQPFVLRRLGD